MGSPKYKSYPREAKNSSEKLETNRRKSEGKVLELRKLIQDRLQKPEAIDKAALIIQSWVNQKAKKP